MAEEDKASLVEAAISTLVNTTEEPTKIGYELREHELHSQNMLNIQETRKLRRKFDKKVFKILWWQIIFLATLMTLQGFGLFGFKLNEWAFGLFINGSLMQSYLLAKHIAADLFNNGAKNKEDR